jgi:Trk K+ transport system NAD-binding subunit
MRILLRSFLVVLGRLKVVIILLILTIIVGAIAHQYYYDLSFDNAYSGDLLDSIFSSFSLLLQMGIYNFPHEGNLIIKLVYIFYPFLGLILIGLGIIEFGMVAFTFRYRVNAWNEWLAKTMRGHTILVGLGNVGTRVLQELVEQKIPTSVITLESEKHNEFVEQMLEDKGVAVIFGDASRRKTLREAGILKARALIVVTDNELMNFKIAVKAKELNPKLRTVIRVFDQVFANRVTEVFDIDAAISTSSITASAFIAKTYEDEIIQSFKSKKTGTDFHLFELQLDNEFDKINVELFEQNYNVTILALDKEAHPEHDDLIEPGANVLVLGDINALTRIKTKYCC